MLATLLVLALVGGGLWWRHSRSASTPERQSTAAPTVGGHNEPTSPSGAASKSTPATASASASSAVNPPASSPAPGQASCPRGAQRGNHPNDGRLHGGGLVVDLPKTFTPRPFQGYDFIGDRGNADRPLTTNGVSAASSITVGSLDRKSFGPLNTAAKTMLTCVFSNSGQQKVDVYELVLIDEATTLQGHPAWRLPEAISASRSAKVSEIEEVEVVDLGGQPYGLFWTNALTADTMALRGLISSRDTLKVGA